MPKDVNLRFSAAAVPITANGDSSVLNTEGGYFGLVSLEDAVLPVDADETLATIVNVSIDGGSNYFEVGRMKTITNAAMVADITTNKKPSYKQSRVFYFPRPASGQTLTKVKLSYTAAGTTPSFPLDAFLEPMVSLSVPAIDEAMANGLARLHA